MSPHGGSLHKPYGFEQAIGRNSTATVGLSYSDRRHIILETDSL